MFPYWGTDPEHHNFLKRLLKKQNVKGNALRKTSKEQRSEETAINQLNSTVLTCWFLQVTDLDDEVGSPAEEFKAFAADSGMNRSQSEYCNVGTKTYLTNHPAKKFVFDFMRVMIIDNLCLTPASKQTPLVDLLLEVEFLWGFCLGLVLLFELISLKLTPYFPKMFFF